MTMDTIKTKTKKKKSKDVPAGPPVPSIIENAEQQAMTDKDWGFQNDAVCDVCGVSNKDLYGLLMQCGKCKNAYFCSSTCYKAGIEPHQARCTTATKLLARNPLGSKDLLDLVGEDLAPDLKNEWIDVGTDGKAKKTIDEPTNDQKGGNVSQMVMPTIHDTDTDNKKKGLHSLTNKKKKSSKKSLAKGEKKSKPSYNELFKASSIDDNDEDSEPEEVEQKINRSSNDSTMIKNEDEIPETTDHTATTSSTFNDKDYDSNESDHVGEKAKKKKSLAKTQFSDSEDEVDEELEKELVKDDEMLGIGTGYKKVSSKKTGKTDKEKKKLKKEKKEKKSQKKKKKTSTDLVSSSDHNNNKNVDDDATEGDDDTSTSNIGDDVVIVQHQPTKEEEDRDDEEDLLPAVSSNSELASQIVNDPVTPLTQLQQKRQEELIKHNESPVAEKGSYSWSGSKGKDSEVQKDPNSYGTHSGKQLEEMEQETQDRSVKLRHVELDSKMQRTDHDPGYILSLKTRGESGEDDHYKIYSGGKQLDDTAQATQKESIKLREVNLGMKKEMVAHDPGYKVNLKPTGMLSAAEHSIKKEVLISEQANVDANQLNEIGSGDSMNLKSKGVPSTTSEDSNNKRYCGGKQYDTLEQETKRLSIKLREVQEVGTKKEVVSHDPGYKISLKPTGILSLADNVRNANDEIGSKEVHVDANNKTNEVKSDSDKLNSKLKGVPSTKDDDNNTYGTGKQLEDKQQETQKQSIKLREVALVGTKKETISHDPGYKINLKPTGLLSSRIEHVTLTSSDDDAANIYQSFTGSVGFDRTKMLETNDDSTNQKRSNILESERDDDYITKSETTSLLPNNTRNTTSTATGTINVNPATAGELDATTKTATTTIPTVSLRPVEQEQKQKTAARFEPEWVNARARLRLRNAVALLKMLPKDGQPTTTTTSTTSNPTKMAVVDEKDSTTTTITPTSETESKKANPSTALFRWKQTIQLVSSLNDKELDQLKKNGKIEGEEDQDEEDKLSIPGTNESMSNDKFPVVDKKSILHPVSLTETTPTPTTNQQQLQFHTKHRTSLQEPTTITTATRLRLQQQQIGNDDETKFRKPEWTRSISLRSTTTRQNLNEGISIKFPVVDKSVSHRISLQEPTTTTKTEQQQQLDANRRSSLQELTTTTTTKHQQQKGIEGNKFTKPEWTRSISLRSTPKRQQLIEGIVADTTTTATVQADVQPQQPIWVTKTPLKSRTITKSVPTTKEEEEEQVSDK